MSSGMDQEVLQKIGKFEILSELGQGGMGVVYKARDPLAGRLVALKTITPELVSEPEILKRFYLEAQSAARHAFAAQHNDPKSRRSAHARPSSRSRHGRRVNNRADAPPHPCSGKPNDKS